MATHPQTHPATGIRTGSETSALAAAAAPSARQEATAAKPVPSYEEPGIAPLANPIPPIPLARTAPPDVHPHLYPRRLIGPTVAIVIDDLGYNNGAVRTLIAADQPLTLAFLPFGTDVGLAHAAATAGLEVIVHMPMEPVGHENPGPGAIRVGMSAGEIDGLVRSALELLPDAIGLNNHMGSKATADLATIGAVMPELAGRGLFFLDSRTSGRSRGQAVAMAAGVPTTGRDVFLDNDASVGAVTAQLLALERIAETRGYAVAIGHPHPGTLEALRRWMPQAEARGIQFTTLSHLVAIDTCRHTTEGMAFICAEPSTGERVARAEPH